MTDSEKALRDTILASSVSELSVKVNLLNELFAELDLLRKMKEDLVKSADAKIPAKKVEEPPKTESKVEPKEVKK